MQNKIPISNIFLAFSPLKAMGAVEIKTYQIYEHRYQLVQCLLRFLEHFCSVRELFESIGIHTAQLPERIKLESVYPCILATIKVIQP